MDGCRSQIKTVLTTVLMDFGKSKKPWIEGLFTVEGAYKKLYTRWEAAVQKLVKQGRASQREQGDHAACECKINYIKEKFRSGSSNEG